MLKMSSQLRPALRRAALLCAITVAAIAINALQTIQAASGPSGHNSALFELSGVLLEVDTNASGHTYPWAATVISITFVLAIFFYIFFQGSNLG